MTPLENIKKGLENQDWGLIANGYRQLTGEYIEVEDNISINKNDIIVSFLENLITQIQDDNDEILEPEEYLVEEEDIPIVTNANERYEGSFKKTKKEVVTPTNSFGTNEKEKLENEARAEKIRQEKEINRRSKPKLMSCDNCQNEFNPLNHVVKTVFDSNKKETVYKCPKCKTEIQ